MKSPSLLPFVLAALCFAGGGVSPFALAEGADLAPEVRMAFKGLSETGNFSFRMSSERGDKPEEIHILLGRIVPKGEVVWNIQLLQTGPATHHLAFRNGVGALKVGDRWLTLDEIPTNPQKAGSVGVGATPRRYLSRCYSPVESVLNEMGKVDGFRKDSGQILGDYSAAAIKAVARQPGGGGIKGCGLLVEIENGLPVRFEKRSVFLDAKGREFSGETILEISSIGSTDPMVPEGARARLEEAARNRAADRPGSGQAAASPTPNPIMGATRPAMGKAAVSGAAIERKAGEEQSFALTSVVKVTMNWIPPGKFTMGSPETERGRWQPEDEVEVEVSKGFWMGETEVTQGQWKAMMGNNPSLFEGRLLPVEQVSWRDAQNFLHRE